MNSKQTPLTLKNYHRWPRHVCVKHEPSQMLSSECKVANTFWSRLKGLLGRTQEQAKKGLLLVPCKSVHTVGMRFGIHLIFIDKHGICVAVYKNVQPLCLLKAHHLAFAVLEFHANVQMPWIKVGDQFTFSPG